MLSPLEIDAPPRILVADEDTAFLLLIQKALEKSEFVVTTCTHGEEAVEAFVEIQPDLVLLGVNLPGMEGVQTCKAIRKRLDGQSVPILLIAAQGDRVPTECGDQAGATDFFTKPLDFGLFTHRARHLVNASRAFSELRYNRDSLARVQRMAKLGSFSLDVETNQAHWSDELYSILGLDSARQPPSNEVFVELIHPQDRQLVDQVVKQAVDTSKNFALEYRLLTRDGDVRHVRHHGEPVMDGRGHLVFTGVVQDTTDHVRAIDRVRQLADFDGLTGLTNRRHFESRLIDTLKHARKSQSLVAVMMIDVDRFKRINETLGHTAGDHILQVVADRLNSLVRNSDCIARKDSTDGEMEVARIGGNEFTLLLPRIVHPTDAGRVAQRIIEALPEPIELEDQSVTLHASVGISVYPIDGAESETLLRQADRAMSFAKSQGGNRFQYYTESLNETSLRRLVLESKLRDAVHDDRFHLLYQPRIDLRSGRVVGMEALLRWVEPELGFVSPDEFIPLAEEIGCISEIGRWVLGEACRQNKAWQDQGLQPVPVAVNVSSRQFSDTDLLELVTQVLKESDLDPRYLEIEITESVMVEDEVATTRTLEALRALGIRIALDDFGTGFSSLSYLRRLPLDILKVDRAFVMDLPEDDDAKGIIAAIIVMAHVLDLQVIAEGVETEEQKSFLRSIDCDEMQGYYFSEPVKPESFEALLRDTSTN